ncbi:HPr family phosphocarrier protein [Salmonella enterica subsp. enterica serovar Lerum]|nr:HPr family phosphocarrier protein [Salmonella enterica subsp. enterica serovar Lerum]EED6908178.1 HPr family phosphocarrier protein [Salmonella enterica subsp. enterica serovar Lerum]HAK3430382.1 HPr family phosphocarrier protein [Salmonella enterica]
MQLCEHDIFVSDECLDKVTALHRVVEKLSAAGNTTPDYLRGMLDREAQISTYLGNGIAIPHGTPESRDAVLQTGVKVIVFRYGVDWGDGNTAYLVTGIAARSNEHLEILRQLTRVLSDDAIPQALAKAESPSQVLTLLTGSTTNTPAAVELQEGEQATFVIHNPHGLHARPSAVLVKFIKQFQSHITVENLDNASGPVDGKNLMRVVSLGAKKGHRLLFRAQGEDAQQALREIEELIASGAGEMITVPVTPPPEVMQPKRSWLSRLFN